ncbi:type II secretion system F family protein [Massilia antarctica]|uniref:type II secretion system F family protein n=1 Tax=Massilia antarctica TaxID=2765360 RepID=UPI0006BB673D|nr:type II secretion system F family protein [Massilia sp. H27-R4]MCY0914928.1 type II secretion system F family protein [Massilia sp. H27-R4]CUI06893.1 Type II/IV secretion system protein TadC, associated with Flp pilus assembly [Janthinobacterium sp. CG23_2]CUU30679.1 Type II/IV secretion system protein TadC, associated with Flp pilus assembly [Janthinobacterium sp. CG23_2]
MFVLAALVFLAVTSVIAGLFLLLVPSRLDKQLGAIGNPAPASDWSTTVAQAVGPFARVLAPTGDWDSSPLRLRFIHAGIRRGDAHLIYFGLKTVLPLVFAGATWLLLRAFTGMDEMTVLMNMGIAALAGCYLPNMALWLRLRERKREIFEHFPDAADLMLVCVEAGLGLDSALNRVAEEIGVSSRALAEELHLTNLEMRAGASRAQSLRNLALRTGIEEIGTFATMLTQSDKFGTSIGESLRVFSEDLRHKRQVRAEEHAAKVPTKMLIPLVLFIFPSIIMVVLGPAMIVIVRTIMPILSAH